MNRSNREYIQQCWNEVTILQSIWAFLSFKTWPRSEESIEAVVMTPYTRSRSYKLKPLRTEPNSARDLLIQGCRVGHYLVSRDPGGKAAHGAYTGPQNALYLSPDISPKPLNTLEKPIWPKLVAYKASR